MNGQRAPHTPSAPPPPPSGGFFDSVRRLGIWRTEDRWAGGVAAGIARRFGIDPLLVRGLFVVVTMFGGLGLVVYGVAWALLPEAADGRIHLEQAGRGDVNIALAGAAAVLIVGLSRPVFWWTASWWAVPWIVALVAVIAVVLLSRDKEPNRPTPPRPGQAASPPGDHSPYTGARPYTGASPSPAASLDADPGDDRPAYNVPEDTMGQPDTAARADETTTSTAVASPLPSDAATTQHPPSVSARTEQLATDTTERLPERDSTEHLPANATHHLPATDRTEQLPTDSTERLQAAATEQLSADATERLHAHATEQRQAGTDQTVAADVELGAPVGTATAHEPGSDPVTSNAHHAWVAGADRYGAQPWSGGSGWGGGSGWDGAGTPPPQPPQTPPPVPGPGSRTTSLVLAVSLLGAAGIALAHHQGVLEANPWLLGGGAVLAVLGLGVLLSGVRGRTQGGLGVLALLLALVMVPAAAATATLPGFSRIGTSATTFAGDPAFVPTTESAAEGGYALVAGELLVDLTQLDADAEVTVPVSVTFGNLNLLVPEDGEITINAGVGGGQVTGRLDGDWTGPNLPWGSSRSADSLTNGVGVSTTVSRDGDGRGPQIVIDAEVTFGQINIEEAS